MYKKIFVLCLLINLSIIFYCELFINKVKTPNYLDSSMNKDITNIELKDKNSIDINAINKEMEKIKSVSIEKMPIKINQNGINIRANASLFYLKDKNFRLIAKGLFSGKEIDLGSNQNQFWFWSKRLEPKYLYYCDHSEIEFSNLKTIFNPIWIMECINIQKIELKNFDLFETKDQIKLKAKRISTLKEEVEVIILVDKKNNLILGRYLYKNNKLVANCEYEYSNRILTKIFFNCKEENILMEWNLKNAQYNKNINNKLWQIPNITPKKNIGIN